MTDLAQDRVIDRGILLERARELAAVLRERSGRSEELRRCPDETINDCIAAGLTRIVQPAHFGGYEMDWDALCEMGMILGRGCASQAWVVTVLAEHAWIVGLFPLQAQRDVWGRNPDVLVASSIVPAGSAERVEGGFRLTGRWGFSSGIHHADWVVLGELVRDASGPPAMHLFLAPKAELEVVDDWDPLGMIGTGSNSVQLDDVFVPDGRVLPAAMIAKGAAPGTKLSAAPVFRMPLSGYAHTALAAVIVGATEEMVDIFADFLRSKAQAGDMPGQDIVHARISLCAAEAKAARALILDQVRANMAKLHRDVPLGEPDALATGRDGAYAALLCDQAARRAFKSGGARSLYRSSLLQRFFRDITSAAAHGGLNWDRAAIAYGRSAAGIVRR